MIRYLARLIAEIAIVGTACGDVNDAELYDPTTGTFRPIDSGG